MENLNQSPSQNSYQPFQHAFVAIRTVQYDNCLISGAYELEVSTVPIHDSIKNKSISITRGPERSRSKINKSADFKIYSGYYPGFTFESELYTDKKNMNYYYGRNFRVGYDPSDFFVLINSPEANEITIIIACNTTWEQWDSFILPKFKTRDFDDHIMDLFSKMKLTS